MTAHAAVEFRCVSKVFDGQAVVDDVSFAIGEGEFFSLLGPSGCGKSTSLRMISGFESPTSGDLLVRGERMNAVPAHKRPTNMVFQQLGLFPHLTVFENVAFGLRLKRVPREEIARRVSEQLDLVNLGGFAGRYPDELSGGQQQRVAIARALVNTPSVLLLDEPLGALDLRLRHRMQQELKSIQRTLGTTFIYVTHDQSEAFAMSDRIAIMNNGKVEQIGTPREIYKQPASSFVADFVGETNLVEGEIVESTPGQVTITALGSTKTVAGEWGEKGDKVTLSIRPESLFVRPAASTSRLSGTIRNAVFLGSYTQLELICGDGTDLLVHVGPLQDAIDFTPGTALAIDWDEAQVAVLR